MNHIINHDPHEPHRRHLLHEPMNHIVDTPMNRRHPHEPHRRPLLREPEIAPCTAPYALKSNMLENGQSLMTKNVANLINYIYWLPPRKRYGIEKMV
jgi:hypothetical protein